MMAILWLPMNIEYCRMIDKSQSKETQQLHLQQEVWWSRMLWWQSLITKSPEFWRPVIKIKMDIAHSCNRQPIDTNLFAFITQKTKYVYPNCSAYRVWHVICQHHTHSHVHQHEQTESWYGCVIWGVNTFPGMEVNIGVLKPPNECTWDEVRAMATVEVITQKSIDIWSDLLILMTLSKMARTYKHTRQPAQVGPLAFTR